MHVFLVYTENLHIELILQQLNLKLESLNTWQREVAHIFTEGHHVDQCD